jgi:hypothetical protein
MPAPQKPTRSNRYKSYTPRKAPPRALRNVTTERVTQSIDVLDAAPGTRPGPLTSLDGIKCRARYAQQLVEADLTRTVAWSGMPSSYGKIRLEKDPELVPLRARGSANDPGAFYDMLNTSEVESSLEEYVSAVVAAPLSLEPSELPPWHIEDARHRLAAVRHYEFAQRVWYEWTRAGLRHDLWTMVSEMARTAPCFGFYIGEIVAVPYVWQLAGDPSPRVYWVPKPLQWRAPWSVREWILQEDEQVGVVLQNTQQVMSDGRVGKFEVALPRRKYIHVQARRMGPNPEGRSHFRSIYENVQMLRDAKEIEALSIEVNGLGTMVVEEPEGGFGTDQRNVLATHLSNYAARHVPYFTVPPGGTAKVLSPSASIHEMGGPINRHTQSIMLGLGNEGRLVGTQREGSFAARQAASDDAWRPYTHLAEGYIARPLQEVLRRLTQWNFPEDVVADRVYSSYVRVGRVEKSTASERLDNMTKAAQLVGTPLQEAAMREVDAAPRDVAGPTTVGDEDNG